ncbi:MAG: PPOX class F420-dependent oxidoreductase [Actinomycetota bacterium]|nr:PPOX class F420-dependent oxidoreductase [Actinomycetota bacterium]MDP2287085.1 PPOX class F420-dependent oxidoreductase [Actinomycetota bacterium]
MTDRAIPETHHDLLDTPISVALATVGPTGYPQVTYVWVIREGNTLVISLPEARQKTKNLRARPKATIFAADPNNPFRTLEIRGDVTINPDPTLATLTEVLAAYGGTLDKFAGPTQDRVTVRLQPTRVVTQG